MRGMNHRPISALLSFVLVMAGCSSSVVSLAPTTSAPSSQEPTFASDPSPATGRPPTPAPSVPVSPPPTQVASDVTVDAVAVTVVDDLRVRSMPRISEDSYKYEPLLPRGTALYVLDGPVSASGYDWYDVAQLSSRALPSGWVAGASRDGEPWVAAGAFDCPPLPTDFRSLLALPDGVGLACFQRVPITVQARLIWCACDIDGAWYTPEWFHLNNNPDLLVEPGVTRVPPDMADWFGLNLDPAGQHPDVLPVGGIVEVTGVFDHPAAAACTRTEMDGKPIASQGCRLEFAVTRLVALRP